MFSHVMHIDTIPNRGSKPTYLLRASVREGNRVKKVKLANLSSLPIEQIEMIRRVLKGERIGERPADNPGLSSQIIGGCASVLKPPLYEGYRRFFDPPQIKSLGMLVVAAIGLAVNLLAMRILSAGKDTDVDMRGAYLEVRSDMVGSLGVLAAAVELWLNGWSWVDTLVAVDIGLWVLPRAWSLLKETVNVLLEGVPRSLDLDRIAGSIRATAGVADLHDLHVWALTSDRPSLSAHLVLAADTDSDVVRSEVARSLGVEFGIRHVTLETERVDCRTLGGSAVVH